MEDTDIITQVLLKLDGWAVKEQIDEVEDFETDTEYNKIISSDEIIAYFNDAIEYANSYTQQEDITEFPISETALIYWTAGLLWNKYNIRSNDQIDDENNFTLGFGDKLVIQAKEMLKPYIKYTITAY